MAALPAPNTFTTLLDNVDAPAVLEHLMRDMGLIARAQICCAEPMVLKADIGQRYW